MDTDFSLQQVLKLIEKEQTAVHMVLATGDMADNGSENAYRRLRDYCKQLPAPAFCVPGNHDNRLAMEAVINDGKPLVDVIDAGFWQILLLDSQVPGEVGGHLGVQQLTKLKRQLERAQQADKHVLIGLHHQPVPVGCAWLDEQMVADADQFFSLIEANPQVRGIIWGHVHQQQDFLRGDIKLMASPSSCVQFAPGSERFRAEDTAPGYRWLELYADGKIETGVSRVSGVSFTVDLDSKGYL